MSPPNVLWVAGDWPPDLRKKHRHVSHSYSLTLALLSLQVSQKVPLVIVQGHLVSEGILLFGQQHFYVCENFTLSPTGDVYCTRHCLSKWVLWFPRRFLQPRLLPIPSLPLPTVYGGFRTCGHGNPKPASGLDNMLPGSPSGLYFQEMYCSAWRPPLGYLDNRLQSHQVTCSTTDWLATDLHKTMAAGPSCRGIWVP